MNIRKKRIFSVVICIAFLFVTFASLFYIAKEENHNCIGEDCPICAGIQQAEHGLRTVGNNSYSDTVCNIACSSVFIYFKYIACKSEGKIK